MTVAPSPLTAEAIDRARDLVESVPDPELPPLTIGELGIVRSVAVDDDGQLVVRVTPTYSGCPAVEFIECRIRSLLDAEGFSSVRVERTFTPAWSSTWMSPSGRAKLKAAGIAPPRGDAAPDQGPVPVALGRRPNPPCPRCDATDTRLVSGFGSTACKALYTCAACLEPFDHFKEI